MKKYKKVAREDALKILAHPPNKAKFLKGKDMNEWERLSRAAKRLQIDYPKGTRIMLLQMGDDPNPVASGTRGTVDFVDDIGTVFVKFDNGRGIGLAYGEDSYRKLTANEIEEENDAICVEETTDDLIGDDENEGFSMTM